jgi:hypothetical protein
MNSVKVARFTLYFSKLFTPVAQAIALNTDRSEPCKCESHRGRDKKSGGSGSDPTFPAFRRPKKFVGSLPPWARPFVPDVFSTVTEG